MDAKYDEKVPIEAVLFGNFIKYESMGRLTLESFNGSNSNTVDVYIDLYQMFLPIYKCLMIKDYTVITTAVINLCAHIRGFYRSRLGVETNIYLIYSPNMSTNNSILYAGYNSTYSMRIMSNQKIHKAVDFNLGLLRTLCPYLPNIYFREGTVEPAVMMHDIICKKYSRGDITPRIIYSKSQYAFQLPSIWENCAVFRKKTYTGQDISRSITPENVIMEYLYETRTKLYENTIHPSLLSLLMTLTNLPQRNVKTLFNVKTAMNLISQIGIVRYTPDIEETYDALSQIKNIGLPKQMFVNRFRAIDLFYQHMLYTNMAESKDDSYLQQLLDPDAVREINDKYFKANPLDLNRL